MVEADGCLTAATESAATFYTRKGICQRDPTEDEYRYRENDAASDIVHLSTKELTEISLENPTAETKCCEASTISVSPIKIKKRFLKNYGPNSLVSGVRSLLSTGLLEGIPIKYNFHKLKVEVPGQIKDLGYLCGCSSCNYDINKVLNAADFGKHLGATKINHNDHIRLSSGKSLFQVTKEVKRHCLGSLESFIEGKIGCTPNWECHKLWKESFQRGSHESEERYPTADANKHSKSEVHTISQIVSSSQPPEMVDALSYLNSRPSSTQHPKKRRSKNLNRLVSMENYLPDGAELTYCVKGQAVLKGYKVGGFIKCCCCNMKITPSQFEAHAGWASKRQPYHHIFTSDGASLHDLYDFLAKRHHSSAVLDECSVCGDGGQLIFCSRCPKTFHLGLDYTPSAEWHCSYCNDNTSVKVIRMIATPTMESGCCSICRSRHFSREDIFNDETVVICDQCEKEFHVGCLRKGAMCNMKVLPRGKWFCEGDCETVYNILQKMVTCGSKILPETLNSQLVKRLCQMGLTVDGYDARWQLLSGKIRSTENKIMLSKAFQIFHSIFHPIIERSGRDLIAAMVHGRDMGGYELGGMYCAILSIKSQVVSAATLRVLGGEAAELSLAATWQESQRMGFFGCLLSCIELLLVDLKVGILMLGAPENCELMWVQKFGFREMGEERRQRLASIYPLLMFTGTKMLEKPLSQDQHLDPPRLDR